jgi:TetR/AcrR family transcriptional regulator
MITFFLETNRESPERIEFLTREAPNPKMEFISQKDEREKVIRSFVENIEERQAKGLVDKSVDPEYLAPMVAALSFYSRVSGAVTKTLTGLSPTDPEFERRWSEFLNQLGRKLEEAKKEDEE